MDDFSDIEAATARLARQRPDSVLAALREQDAAPTVLPEPTIIPSPEFPYGLRSPGAGTARFLCPLGCGWYHEEDPAAEQLGPLLLPAGFTTADLSAAITNQADARAAAGRARIEAALAAHFADKHPTR